jgi:glucose/arabinose dehydrogenase
MELEPWDEINVLMATHKWSRLTIRVALRQPWSIRKRIRDIEEASDGSLWMLEDANPGGLFQSIWKKRKGDCHVCRTHIA